MTPRSWPAWSQRPEDIPPEVWATTLAGQLEALRRAWFRALAAIVSSVHAAVQRADDRLDAVVQALDDRAGTCPECGELHPPGWTGPTDDDDGRSGP